MQQLLSNVLPIMRQQFHVQLLTVGLSKIATGQNNPRYDQEKWTPLQEGKFTIKCPRSTTYNKVHKTNNFDSDDLDIEIDVISDYLGGSH
jgi:hypothetical protein